MLNQFGIKVIGEVSSSSELPDASTYQGEYGDAYAVGTETPYELYIFTRQFSGNEGPIWFNIGRFPVPGPAGTQGSVGPQGIAGARGSTWTVGLSTPTTTSGFRQYDMYLNVSTGEVYQYNGSTWQNVGSIKGPQGIQGLVGPEGPQGIQGPVGPQGIQGPAGDPFTIVGTLTNTDQLPEPTEDIREQAYLIEIDGLNHLFVIVGTTDLSWYDVGALEGIQGPVGPQGPQGEVGPTNTLTIGTVTTLDTGVPATASITGTAPNQVLNLGLPRGLSGANGTVINVAGSEAHTLSFTTDPQTQLNTISGNVNTNQANISSLQSDVAEKSSVYVNNSLSNVSFTSDPQTQIDNLNANKADINDIPTNYVSISTDQEITGVKTFTNQIDIGVSGDDSKFIKIVPNELSFMDNAREVATLSSASDSLSGGLHIDCNGVRTYGLYGHALLPLDWTTSAPIQDLGNSVYTWKNLYLNGKISNGSQNVTVSQLYDVVNNNITSTEVDTKISTALQNYYTKTDTYSQTQVINLLQNFYTKENTYNKTEVNGLISSVSTGGFQVVTELPASGEYKVIYLVSKSQTSEDNIYDEYIWVNNDWELIGTTQIDLSNYVTNDSLSSTLSNYVLTTSLNSTLENYSTTSEINQTLNNYVTNDTLNTRLNNKSIQVVSALPESPDANTIYFVTGA